MSANICAIPLACAVPVQERVESAGHLEPSYNLATTSNQQI